MQRSHTRVTLSVILFVAFCGSVWADHLPPVHPLVIGGIHIHEDHSGHDHSGENLQSVNFTNADLSGANLSSTNLRLASLSDADLSGANLSFSELFQANLNGANLTGANLSSSTVRADQLQAASGVTGVNLSGGNLDSGDLSSLDLTGANFTNTVLFGTVMSNTNLRGAILQNPSVFNAITAVQLQAASDVTAVNLSGNNLNGFDLGGLNLSSANLASANLASANLSGADLASANLTSADLRNTNVAEAITANQLGSAGDLTSVNLAGNDLSGANLSVMVLTGANLESTNLSSALLAASVLNFANLSSANLAFANLSGTGLGSANLMGADLRNTNVATAITAAQLQAASDVTHVNLAGNNLSGFDLSGLNLSFVNLVGADLSAANLTGTNLHQASLPAVLPMLPAIASAQVNVTSELTVTGPTTVDAFGNLGITGAGPFSTNSATNAGTIFISDSPVDFGPGGMLNNHLVTFKDTTVSGTIDNPDGSTILVRNRVVLNDLLSGGGNIQPASLGAGIPVPDATLVLNDGHAPGDGLGVVSIGFGGIMAVLDVEYGSTNTLMIELGGSVIGEFDRIEIWDSVTLGGMLDVELVNDFVPGAGQSFEIIDVRFGTLSGTFSGLAEGGLVGNFGGTDLFITYAGGTGNDVVLFTTGLALAGDYNGNGIVDAADYTVWRDNLGAPAGTLPNDTDGGVIGEAQYTTWKANFGNAAGVGSGSAGIRPSDANVPEPATWALLAICLPLVVSGTRRRTVPAYSVQYHPEASAGPHDSHYLFRRFYDSMSGRVTANR